MTWLAGMRTRPLVTACAIVGIIGAGIVAEIKDLRHVRSLPPRPRVDERYAPLAPYLDRAAEAGFLSDKIKEAPTLFYGAQYALAPTALRGEPDPMALLQRLLRGYDVICDFRDARLLKSRLEILNSEARRAGIRVDVFRIEPTLLLVRTRKP